VKEEPQVKVSDQGKGKIREWEGFRARAYRDAGGKLTIGVGHLLTQSELSSGKIFIQGQPVRYAAGLSDQQVLDLLGQDLAGAEQAVNDGVEVELSQNQFDALVSFCFNVGRMAFKNSTLLRLLNQGEYDEVPAQLRRWVRCNGKVIPGLVKRREQEIELWNA
jgi:lysozyme